MAGIAYELFKEIAQRTQTNFVVANPISWSEANKLMDSGVIDVISGHYWSKKRDQKWLISDPLFLDDVRVLFHFSLRGKITNLNSV